MSAASEVFVLFLLVLAGIACRKLRYMTDEVIHGVTQLVVNLSLPCLTLYNMQREFTRERLQNFLLTLLLAALTILACIAVGWWLFRKRPARRRSVLANFCGFSNCGFIGYPIILAVNPELMLYAVAYNIAYLMVSWTVGVSMFGGGQITARERMRRAVLNPNIICSLAGFALFCLRFTWPPVFSEALRLIGGLTTPLSMMLIGTRVLGLHADDLRDKDYALITLLRNLAIPVLLYLLMLPFPIDAEVRAVVALLSAMPLGSLVAMQAELYGGDVAFAARATALSTLFSLISIPLITMLIV